MARKGPDDGGDIRWPECMSSTALLVGCVTTGVSSIGTPRDDGSPSQPLSPTADSMTKLLRLRVDDAAEDE